MMSYARNLTAAALIAAGLAAPAAAATLTGFTLSASTLGGSQDSPVFTLTNDSDNGATLDAVTITVGDVAYNFDRLMRTGGFPVAPAGGTVAYESALGGNAGARADEISLSFTGFDGGESAQFRAELDRDAPDGADSWANFRYIFFNNGGAANAVAEVTFSNGAILNASFEDALSSTQPTYAASAVRIDGASLEAAVPVPAAMPLLAAALGVFGLLRTRARG